MTYTSVTLTTISLMSCSEHPETKEKRFWRWFQSNEARLFDFEKDQERTFDELQAHLHNVQPNLTFEFGPKKTVGASS